MYLRLSIAQSAGLNLIIIYIDSASPPCEDYVQVHISAVLVEELQE